MSESSDPAFPLRKASAIQNTPTPLHYNHAVVLLSAALLPKDISEWTWVCPETSAFKNKAEMSNCRELSHSALAFQCKHTRPHVACRHTQTHRYIVGLFHFSDKGLRGWRLQSDLFYYSVYYLLIHTIHLGHCWYLQSNIVFVWFF